MRVSARLIDANETVAAIAMLNLSDDMEKQHREIRDWVKSTAVRFPRRVVIHPRQGDGYSIDL